MSGGAKRSPLDLLVLPQPVDFFPKKIDKITKNFNERARLRSRIRINAGYACTRPQPRNFTNFGDFSIFSLAYPLDVGKNGAADNRRARTKRSFGRAMSG